jgi:hypothetical protein
MAREIVTIAAATGWSAEIESGDAGAPARRVTLVGWALVEEGTGDRTVVGLVLHPRTPEEPQGRIGLVDEEQRFLGYSFNGMRMQPS